MGQAEQVEFESQLFKDSGLKQSFLGYLKVLAAEKFLREQKFSLNANFIVKLMNQIEKNENHFLRRLKMKINLNKRSLMTGTACLATLAIVVVTASHVSKLDTGPSSIIPGPETQQAPAVKAPATIPVTKSNDSDAKAPKEEAKRTIASGQRIYEMEQQETAAYNQVDKPVKAQISQLPHQRAVSIVEGLADLSHPLQRKDGSQSVKLGKGKIATRGALSINKNDLLGSARHTRAGRPAAVSPIDGLSSKKEVYRSEEKHLGRSKPAGLEGGRWTAYRGQPEPFADEFVYRQQQRIYQPAANNERYIGYTENARTAVLDEALSTFSIDVDTGSYTNARRFLQQGQFPPQESIRIEEFVNYFKYNYPVQTEKPFTLTYEIAPSPLEQDRYLLNLGIKARDASVSDKPWNLVFLIDVSGSMSASNKLELVKKSLRILVGKMRASDRIAIVTYAGSAGVALPSTGFNQKERILQVVNSLRAGGSTYGSSGIEMAYRVANNNRINGGVNRVILATDGDFNVGVTSHQDLIRMIEEKRRSGITLTTVGVGSGNYKEATMEQLANKGNGNYFYIDNYKEARKVFETDLFANMEVVAKDVKLQIEFNPNQVAEYRLIGYDNRKLRKEDFNNDRIDAGEIGAGHTVTALYEIVLKDSPLADKINSEYRYQKREQKKLVVTDDHAAELAFLKIRYKQPEGTKSKLIEYPIESSQIKSDSQETTEDFRFAAAVSYFGHLLRGSQYSGSYTYADIVQLAEQSKGRDAEGYRRELIELVKNAETAYRSS